eukprot:7158085-Prymnesium_polylepis.1
MHRQSNNRATGNRAITQSRNQTIGCSHAPAPHAFQCGSAEAIPMACECFGSESTIKPPGATYSTSAVTALPATSCTQRGHTAGSHSGAGPSR